ncbi:translin-associated protein X isoform X3 [Columba livia]
MMSFKSFQLELDTRHDKYERLVKLSRDITIESKRTIFLLHRFISAPNGEEILNESEVKLDAVRRKIKQVAQELIGEDMYQFHRAISPGPCLSGAEGSRAGCRTQVGSHQSRGEGQNHLPGPSGRVAFAAAQDTIGLLGCKHTLLDHVQSFIHRYTQVILRRAALNPFNPQPVLILGVALTQAQDLALCFVEPHEVHTGPLLKLVQVPLDDILSLRYVNCITQLGVIHKLAEGALNPNICVIDEDIKQYWSQSEPMRDVMRSCCLVCF